MGKRLDAIIIIGDTLHEIKRYHDGRVINVNGEKMLQVEYRRGFGERYTYGRIGDHVCYVGDTNVCVPKDLYREFADGWLDFNNDGHIEPFAEYYEIFAANHTDQLVKEPRRMKIENAFMKHWFINAILLGLAATGLMILISEVWTSIIH